MDSKIRELLEDVQDCLEKVGCMFFACEGPDKPPEHMKTCFVCDTLRRVKEVLKE